MAYIAKTYTKAAVSGDSSAVYSAKVDTALWNLAKDLDAAGWTVEYRYPIAFVSTQNIEQSFSSDPVAWKWSVGPSTNPPNPGDLNPPVGGWQMLWSAEAGVPIPPANYNLWPVPFVVGVPWDDPTSRFRQTLDAMAFWDSRIVELGPDPGAFIALGFPPERNMSIEYREDSWIARGKAKLVQGIVIPGTGLNLRIGGGDPSIGSLGGYACRSAANGVGNTIDLFCAEVRLAVRLHSRRWFPSASRLTLSRYSEPSSSIRPIGARPMRPDLLEFSLRRAHFVSLADLLMR